MQKKAKIIDPQKEVKHIEINSKSSKKAVKIFTCCSASDVALSSKFFKKRTSIPVIGSSGY